MIHGMKFLILSLVIISTLGIIIPSAYAEHCLGPCEIQWTKDFELSWDHFQNEKKSCDSDYYTPKACISTYISASWNIEKITDNPCRYRIDVDSIAYLNPHSSWVNSTMFEKSTESQKRLLVHEMGHFHITQFHANELMKLDSDVQEKTYACINQTFDYQKINKDLQRHLKIINDKKQLMHDEYDFETTGSENTTKQNEWNDKINNFVETLPDIPLKPIPEPTITPEPEIIYKQPEPKIIPSNSTISTNSTSIIQEDIEKIPDWIKNIFIWYGLDMISESELISALEFLINEEIIKVD